MFMSLFSWIKILKWQKSYSMDWLYLSFGQETNVFIVSRDIIFLWIIKKQTVGWWSWRWRRFLRQVPHVGPSSPCPSVWIQSTSTRWIYLFRGGYNWQAEPSAMVKGFWHDCKDTGSWAILSWPAIKYHIVPCLQGTETYFYHRWVRSSVPRQTVRQSESTRLIYADRQPWSHPHQNAQWWHQFT